MLITLIVVAIVVIGVGVPAIVIVPPGSAYVVERLGRYRTTLSAGLNVIAPLIDRVAFRFSLASEAKELAGDYETKDQKHVHLVSAFQARVLDPQRAAYGAADAGQFVSGLIQASERRRIANRMWEALREDRRSFQREVLGDADAASDAVGVKVLEYEVRDLQVRA